MGTRSPRDLAAAVAGSPRLPRGTDERFSGYGVMGLPFAGGHYLALRVFPATSIGPGYEAVWHRDPAGRWTIYASAPPERSCARYFGAALAATERTPIDVEWDGPDSFAVRIRGILDWVVRLRSTAGTRMLSGSAALVPEAAWRSDAVLAVMARTAGPVLRAGRVVLSGRVPNGQHFRAAPRRLWTVADSSARLGGEDLGPTGRLARQDRLGDFWLPQRGLFVLAQASFDVLDPARHRPAAAHDDVDRPFSAAGRPRSGEQ